ncbi:MAG: respiratory nitrate reductase subunit gamma [Desulfomonilaceae bacterium]|jgi:nitrate reductase gamma subunit
MENLFYTLAFLVFPYIALTVFALGHSYRYRSDIYHWNSKSSELVDRDNLKVGISIFHWGIIFTFLGHFFGLLTPQLALDRLGITAEIHDFMAIYTGMVFGAMALLGLLILLRRRLIRPRVRSTSSINDVILLTLLVFVVFMGTYNTYFKRFDVLSTIAPWIRSIVTFHPDPRLMIEVPWSYKIHILAALTLLGFSPFTRLVHIWSIPLTYFLRPYLSFRRRFADTI